MKQGDLLDVIGLGCRLYPDMEEWKSDDLSAVARKGEVVVFMGRVTTSWFRVLHPVHGIRRVHWQDVRMVNNEAR
jgi:hypothetical protein